MKVKSSSLLAFSISLEPDIIAGRVLSPLPARLFYFTLNWRCGAIRSGHAVGSLNDLLERQALLARGKGHSTYKNLLGITDPPGKIQYVAIGLDYLGR